MALNTSKCNHVMPLRYKRLKNPMWPSTQKVCPPMVYTFHTVLDK